MREVMHHGGLKHPFIIDLKEVFLTPEYLAIVMEFAQGGNVRRPPPRWGGAPRSRRGRGRRRRHAASARRI